MSAVTCLSLDQSLITYVATALQKIQKESQETYLKTTVILPTRRAVKELKQALLCQAPEHTTLLPKIRAVTDLTALDPRRVLSETKRTGLILTVLKSLDPHSSPEVARLLMSLLDEINTHETKIEKLSTIVPEIYAEHWQLTATFLKNFLNKWQEVLDLEKAIEPSAHSILTLKNLRDSWTLTPPEFPVFLAGLDGFIPAVKDLMTCVQTLPQGHVILNGYLPTVMDETYATTHPNYLLTPFITPLDCPPNDRAHLVAHLMSDTPLEERNTSRLSFDGVSLLEAETLDQEAQSIALLARQNLEDPTKTTAIITPDHTLAEKIQLALSRWHIRVDLAGGVPLSTTPFGRFMLDALNLQAPHVDAPTFLSLLKSPFVSLGYETSFDLKKQVRSFEKKVLRTDPGHRSVPEEDTAVADLMDRFNTATSDFFTLKTSPQQPFLTWLHGHITLLERLNPSLWESDTDTIAKLCFQDLLHNAPAYPALSLKEYHDLVRFTFSQQTLRDAVNHPRLKLLSPIQGAYSHYDCAILGGLNEGTWPQHSPTNPWLNRDMSLALGLPDTQMLIGRAASLLAQNMTCPEVVLSYAKRRGTEPASPSRWVLRFQTVAQKMGQDIHLKTPLKEWHNRLDHPHQTIALLSPHALPPLTARPKRFSISDIERFFRDPYQIYAKHILTLRPVRALNEPFGPAEFGTWIHKILEQSIAQKKNIEDLALPSLPKHLPADTRFLWLRSFHNMQDWIQKYLIEQAKASLETLVEKKLTASFSIQNSPYELIGKADRIDRLMDGTYEIIDYKTGGSPSKKALETGDAPQLPLLAYLVEKNIPHAHVSTLTYVNLNTQKVQKFKRGTLVEDTVARLMDTFEHYHQLSHAYTVNPYEALQDRFNPYGHLERTTEWLENRASDA